jgi:hypothetical protein
MDPYSLLTHLSILCASQVPVTVSHSELPYTVFLSFSNKQKKKKSFIVIFASYSRGDLSALKFYFHLWCGFWQKNVNCDQTS